MDGQVINCWLSATGKVRRIFKSNHFFISNDKSLCGQCKLWNEDKKYIRIIRFKEIFESKICKRCIYMCEVKGIDYKT